ncbi:MAG: hypothetical protein AVDCRST_MAG19-3236, partial [uncultured Thermomicrobiales bacterium]
AVGTRAAGTAPGSGRERCRREVRLPHPERLGNRRRNGVVFGEPAGPGV